MKEDMALFAKWQEVKTVTFVANGGSDVKSPVIVDTGSCITLETPILKNHTFLGWFYQTSGGKVRLTETTPINEDMTVVAEEKQSNKKGSVSLRIQ